MKYILILFFFVNTTSLCNAAMQEQIDRRKIIKLLEDAYQRDQAPRLIIDSLMRNGVTDGNLFLPSITQQREADSINLQVILSVVDTLYRFKIYDLDPIAYKQCWVLIQHSDNQIMIKYADFVEELAKRNLISVSSYMAFVDRLQINQEKAQIYGYQFKRLANGTLIQFPILKGKNKRWKELGCYSNMNNVLPSDYKINYQATQIKKNEFLVIGFLYQGESDSPIEDLSPLGNIQILLNKHNITRTDSCGYFKVIFNKKKLPSCIEVIINGTSLEYKIKQNGDKDFLISIGYFHNGKIDVTSE